MPRKILGEENLNLIWWNQAKYYCDRVEDPAFFKTFDWLQVELGYRDSPTCKPYQEKYTYITEEEMAKIETNIREKWGDI